MNPAIAAPNIKIDNVKVLVKPSPLYNNEVSKSYNSESERIYIVDNTKLSVINAVVIIAPTNIGFLSLNETSFELNNAIYMKYTKAETVNKTIMSTNKAAAIEQIQHNM